MKCDYLVWVWNSVSQSEQIVLIKNASDETHARLAGYYYVMGTDKEPTLKKLKTSTSCVINPKNIQGPVDASVYFEYGIQQICKTCGK